MIELELRFELDGNVPDMSKYPVVKQLHQEDVYYDTKGYDMLRAGNFLRVRNDYKIDFKTNLDDPTHLYCKETSFKCDEISQKISEINDVLKMVGLPHDKSFGDFSSFVKNNDLNVLSLIKKDRIGYKVTDKLKVYLDNAQDMGWYLEAEYMIDAENITKEQGQSYKEEMLSILREKGIISDKDKMVNIGYVELYLEKHNPEAYRLGLYQR
jgi:adenylate cyclase class IV